MRWLKLSILLQFTYFDPIMVESICRDFKNYFSRHGLIHETTCPQTPQQNEIAERKNRHILETTRAILLGAHVPNHFWTDAVTTAVHLINRMPSKVLKFKTPLQALSTVISLPTALCFRLEYLAVLPSFIYTRISALNSIPAQSSVFFWGMAYIKRDIVVMIHLIIAPM